MINSDRIEKNYGEIVYQDDKYIVTFDIIPSTPRLFQVILLSNGRQVGMLNTKEIRYQGKNYLEVNGVNIEPRHRSKGFGKMMYRTLIDHSPSNIQGLISNLKKQFNKKEIPSIYKRLGSIEEDGYAIINFS